MRGLCRKFSQKLQQYVPYYWECAERLSDAGVLLGVGIIKFSALYKDRGLSRRLHDLADQYDPRPTGEWQ